jgi:hypothetical protein
MVSIVETCCCLLLIDEVVYRFIIHLFYLLVYLETTKMPCLKSLSFCYLNDKIYGIVESEVILSAETYAAHRECVAILILPLAVAYTLTCQNCYTSLYSKHLACWHSASCINYKPWMKRGAVRVIWRLKVWAERTCQSSVSEGSTNCYRSGIINHITRYKNLQNFAMIKKCKKYQNICKVSRRYEIRFHTRI